MTTRFTAVGDSRDTATVTAMLAWSVAANLASVGDIVAFLAIFQVTFTLALAGCGIAIFAQVRVTIGLAGLGNWVAGLALFRVAAGAVTGDKQITIAGVGVAPFTIRISRIADDYGGERAGTAKKRLCVVRADARRESIVPPTITFSIRGHRSNYRPVNKYNNIWAAS